MISFNKMRRNLNTMSTEFYWNPKGNRVTHSYTKEVLKEKELKEKLTKEKDTIPYKEILADLNEKAGTNFRHTTKAHKDKIKARWNEGNTFEDFQRVHSNLVAYWKGDPKME